MTEYTHTKVKEIATLALREYDIIPINITPIAEDTTHNPLRVEDSKGNTYFVKVSDATQLESHGLSVHEYATRLAFTEQLQDHGLDIPQNIKTKVGTFFTKVRDKNGLYAAVEVQEFVPGKNYTGKSGQAEKFGRALGKFHALAASLTDGAAQELRKKGKTSVLGLKDLDAEVLTAEWTARYEAVKDVFYSSISLHIKSLIRSFPTHYTRAQREVALVADLPREVIHHGIHQQQVVIEEDGPARLVDWETARYGPIALDIGDALDRITIAHGGARAIKAEPRAPISQFPHLNSSPQAKAFIQAYKAEYKELDLDGILVAMHQRNVLALPKYFERIISGAEQIRKFKGFASIRDPVRFEDFKETLSFAEGQNE